MAEKLTPLEHHIIITLREGGKMKCIRRVYYWHHSYKEVNRATVRDLIKRGILEKGAAIAKDDYAIELTDLGKTIQL